jgi:hypothetical protein
VYDAGEAVRTIAGVECTIAIFLVVSANSILRILGPEELSGLGDLRAKIEARVADGEEAHEAADKVKLI